MARYHINPQTGDPGVCKAMVKCPYGDLDKDHYDSKEAARKAYEKVQERGKKALKTPRPPILLEPSPYREPLFWDTSFSTLEDATDIEFVDYYSDDYSDFTTVDPEKAVELVVGIPRADWPEGLARTVAAHRDEWADVANWDFELGFYEGDSPTLTPPRSLEAKLQEWYYSQPNAVDYQGVLEHVREKGFDTSGLTPVEAVKKMLREENGMVLKNVERATSVRRAPVDFHRISYAKTHYDRILEQEPQPVSPRSQPVLGVVKYHPSHYRMLDGHHRFKWARTRNETSGDFLVLY